MMCSALLKNGLRRIREVELEMSQWMEEHEYESVEQMKDSPQICVANPSSFEDTLEKSTGQRTVLSFICLSPCFMNP